MVSRVALRADDIPLGEQTVAQVSYFYGFHSFFLFSKNGFWRFSFDLKLNFSCHPGSTVSKGAAEMVPVEVINVNILHLLIEQSNQQDFTKLGKHVGLLIINDEICYSQICLKMARVTLSMKVSCPNQSGLGPSLSESTFSNMFPVIFEMCL